MTACHGREACRACLEPQETCYELYTYKTSGLPVNCYGQRYINNRIAQLAAAQAQREAMANATAADRAKGGKDATAGSRGGPPNGKKDASKPNDGGAAGAEDAKVASKPADAGTGSQATTAKDSASSSKDSAGAGAAKGKGGKKAVDSSKQKKSG